MGSARWNWRLGDTAAIIGKWRRQAVPVDDGRFGNRIPDAHIEGAADRQNQPGFPGLVRDAVDRSGTPAHVERAGADRQCVLRR